MSRCPAVPGDPVLRARSLAAMESALVDITQLASAATGPYRLRPVEGLAVGRRLSAMDKQLTCLSVLAMLAEGATWEQVAAELGRSVADAQLLYGEAWERWRSGDPKPWLPSVVGHEVGARAGGASP